MKTKKSNRSLTPEEQKELWLQGKIDTCKKCGATPAEWDDLCRNCWGDDL